jgi:soluble lytic murein transglycosylase
MEQMNIKKWIKPAVEALPSKRVLLLAFTVLVLFMIVAIPLFNRLMYPLDYEEYIFDSAQETGADPFLVMAIIRQESKFDPDKKSPVGAQGLMQLMPDTVNDIIRDGHFSPAFRDYVFDPATNIRMGSWYIKFLSDRYKGNYVAVIAAYNGGLGNVDKWLRDGTWDGTRQNLEQIKLGETRHYVARVSYYYEKYKQLYKKNYEDYLKEQKEKKMKQK